ncbi:uncharacterized protein LOC119643715 isoform X4 [Glossina fuscipes]|uniref:Uncharacterized protein LOC119643715 isoform X4 n=1 Tax=Glossina fuscipes TaxID=7396 RepID=A0A9C6E081_9MUSC|nr:uncharacterized protein LOC119643715 isoform X4 [Glossina fuscipes]
MLKSRSLHDLSIKEDDGSGGYCEMDKINGSCLKKSQTFCVVERNRGFKPSDRHDPAKKKFLLDLSKQIWQKSKVSPSLSGKINLSKIFTPAEDTKEIFPRNRKLYGSSAFYCPLLHPTVEDQIELARRISQSLGDISNQKSKGQFMYCNRKKRSVKWVHEASQKDGNPTQLEAENYKRETKENEGIYLRNTKLPLRLLMNPRGRMRDFNSCTVHEAFNTDAGLLSPNNCAELLTALRGYKDKGAELFAKRRKVAEKWVVDETNVGAQRPSDLLDYYEQQQQSQHASSPNMLPAYKAKDRKQSNVQQNQLLEQSGLNAAEKLDETALTSDSIILKKQTNKMEFSNSRSISNLPPPIHREFCLTEKEDFITLSKIYPQILHGVTSNSSTSDIQRDLAYKPCIPQGWKTPSINLPQIRSDQRCTNNHKLAANVIQICDDLNSMDEKEITDLISGVKMNTNDRGSSICNMNNYENLRRLHHSHEFNKSEIPGTLVCKRSLFIGDTIDKEMKDQSDSKPKQAEETTVQKQLQLEGIQTQMAEPHLHHKNFRKKYLYVPKKIPLQSYAAPPSFSSCTSRVQMIFPNKKYQSYDLDNGRPKQIQRQTSAIVSTSTLKNSQPDLLGSKNSRHISSIRVNEVSQLSNRSTIPTQETGQNTTQVNFNPSQLPQAKLAKFGHASSEPRDVYSDKRFLQIEPNISKISPANAINLPKPLLGACDILHQRNFRYPKSTLGQHNLTNSRRNDSHILYAPTYNNSACGWSKYNVSKSVLTNQYRTSVESAEAQLSLPCMPYTDF